MSRRFHEDFPITSLLLLLVIGFYVLELVAERKLTEIFVDAPFYEVLVQLGGLRPALVFEELQVWRLFTCVFLHGGLLHIFMNGSVLFDLGRFCEPFLSPSKFFTVYILCGVGGALGTCGSAYLRGNEYVILSVGASGALCGLIGLMLVFSIRRGHRDLRDRLMRWVLFIAILSLLPGIDLAGHLGGFATGCLLGFTVTDYTTSTSAERWRIPSYAAGAALAAALGMGVWNYFAFVLETS